MHTITVFTPAYNRAALLPRLYESLKQQTLKPFEWIIVDDGSQDETRHVVEEFIKQAVFPVRYLYQTNKGKHFAINRGVGEAQGEYFFIVDSDDALPKNSLKIVQNAILKIHNHPNIGGVSGRCQTPNGEPIGQFPGETHLANALDIRYKHKVTGDLAEVFRTSVLKQYPFPEIEGEKFCPEALVWNRIAQDYKLKYINEIIYTAEYQNNGLSAKIVAIRMQSPMASMLTYSELSADAIPLKEKIKAGINFWRFAFNSAITVKDKVAMLNILWSLPGLPLGYIMYLKDQKNTRRN